MVRLYDFDRAYSVRFGNNPRLKYFNNYSHTNEFIPNRDVVKIWSCIYRYVLLLGGNERIAEQLVDVLLPIYPEDDPSRKKFVKSVLEGNYKNLKKSHFENNFQSIDKILENVGKKLSLTADTDLSKKPDGVEEYECNPEMFDELMTGV